MKLFASLVVLLVLIMNPALGQDSLSTNSGKGSGFFSSGTRKLGKLFRSSKSDSIKDVEPKDEKVKLKKERKPKSEEKAVEETKKVEKLKKPTKVKAEKKPRGNRFGKKKKVRSKKFKKTKYPKPKRIKKTKDKYHFK